MLNQTLSPRPERSAPAAPSPSSRPGPLSAAELREAAARLKWFHRLDLGQGVITDGLYDPQTRLHELRLPDSLAGRSVLDVGAWDGFYSFEAERRGAERVVATDWFCWEGPGWGTKSGFELARRATGSRVEDVSIDVLDLSAATVGRHDIVLCLGVLYHMRHPMLALERILDVTGDLLILETEVDMQWCRRPAGAFYPGSELGLDDTNWWGLNTAAVTGMLRAVGFRTAEVATSHSLLWRAPRAVSRRLVKSESFLQSLQRDRVVFHARR